VTLDYNLNESSSGLFSIYTTTGQLVYSLKIENSIGSQNIDTETFNPGMYFYRLESEEASVIYVKLVVVK
jgi:hypothetical protein